MEEGHCWNGLKRKVSSPQRNFHKSPAEDASMSDKKRKSYVAQGSTGFEAGVFIRGTCTATFFSMTWRLLQGTGESRHLCIFTKALASVGIGKLSSMLPAKTQKEVKRVWNMCQMEGGRFWDYSQDEIAELLMSKTGLPEEIRQIYKKREKGTALCGLIRDGEVEGALGILADDSKTAHMRDEVSGGFPIHLACFRNLEPVVHRLLEIPGVLEQRDGMRCTALDVAKSRGFETLTSLLEDRGMASSLAPGDKKGMHLMAETYDSWQSKGEKDFLLFGKSFGRDRGKQGNRSDNPSRWGSEENTEKW